MGVTLKDLDEEFLTIPEAARLLRLSKAGLRVFIDRGLLARFKVGGKVIIHRDDLEKFLEGSRQILDPAKRVKRVNPIVNGMRKKGRPQNEG